MIINTEDRAGESQNFTEGNQNGIVNFPGRSDAETRNKQAAPHHNQEHRDANYHGRFMSRNIHSSKYKIKTLQK